MKKISKKQREVLLRRKHRRQTVLFWVLPVIYSAILDAIMCLSLRAILNGYFGADWPIQEFLEVYLLPNFLYIYLRLGLKYSIFLTFVRALLKYSDHYATRRVLAVVFSVVSVTLDVCVVLAVALGFDLAGDATGGFVSLGMVMSPCVLLSCILLIVFLEFKNLQVASSDMSTQKSKSHQRKGEIGDDSI